MCNKNHSDSESKCNVCGNTFINSGRGRTREYCNDDCKNINSFLNSIESKLIGICFKSEADKKALKSRIWSISNLIQFKIKG